MTEKIVFETLQKLRDYAEETNQEHLIVAVENAENAAMSEGLGTKFLQERPHYHDVWGGSFPMFRQEQQKCDGVGR